MSFNHALDVILGAEGGYSDDADDPGGKTRYGITESVARIYGYYGDMKEFPLETAKMIYQAEYWYKAKCELYPPPLDLLMFDCAVNQGQETAIKLLQKALGVAQDGVVGNATKRRLQEANIPELCAMFMADRALRYVGTRNFDKFGRGWLKRLFLVMQRS